MPQTAPLPRPDAAARLDAIAFENSYADLPERFHQPLEAQAVRAPSLIRLNRPLAVELGLDPDLLESPEGVAMLAGNRFPAAARPLAQAYAGHQFGGFVPQLGDGRALLIGELRDRDGRLRDLQLKGSGRTRYSRGGDGRAALGPVLREYVVSEAMHALGIPTTRALAAVATGEGVLREDVLPGGVVARVAASHIRIGTFQYFAARGDLEGLRLLADHAIGRHHPQLAGRDDRHAALLGAVVAAQADLVARWMLVGFIHGVMNTDNMTVSGETIDYGPCAFMDAYHPGTVFSSIDRQGRYAYANQPHVAVWNLARLAEAMLPLIGPDEEEAVARAREVLEGFQPAYEATFHAGMRRKLGLLGEEAGDLALASDLLEIMAREGADFTLTFRGLAGAASTDTPLALPGSAGGTVPDEWVGRWRARLAREPGREAERAAAMRRANPRYIARNHRVEAAISAAVEREDFEPFHELVRVLERPFDEQPEFEAHAAPPAPHERVLRTFCGT